MPDWSYYVFFIPCLPSEMASHWARWMIVEQNKLYLNFMCSEFPWKLYVWSLQRHMLPCWMDFLLVRAVRNATTWACYYYSLEKSSARDLGICWYLPLYMEWIKSHWGRYSLRCTRSVQFGAIVSSLMYVTVENSLSNTTLNWGDTWPVSGFKTRATGTELNGEWPRYIPSREWGSHLFSLAIFTFNLVPKT